MDSIVAEKCCFERYSRRRNTERERYLSDYERRKSAIYSHMSLYRSKAYLWKLLWVYSPGRHLWLSHCSEIDNNVNGKDMEFFITLIWNRKQKNQLIKRSKSIKTWQICERRNARPALNAMRMKWSSGTKLIQSFNNMKLLFSSTKQTHRWTLIPESILHAHTLIMLIQGFMRIDRYKHTSKKRKILLFISRDIVS